MSTLDQERTAWAVALLAALNLPISVNGLVALVAWETAEGGGFGNEAENNPLNTTQDWPGSWTINSDGVRGYASYADGLGATVQTLGYGAYVSILAALRAGADPYATATTVGATPWGTPTALMSACIPESQAAVAANYHRNGGSMIIVEPDGVHYEEVTVNGNTRWLALVTKDVAKLVAAGVIVVADNDGGLLNRFQIVAAPVP